MGLFGGAGLGKTIVIQELIARVATRHGGNSEQIRQRLRETLPLSTELKELLQPSQEPFFREEPPEDESDGMHFCSVCGSPLDAVMFEPRAGPLGVAA